MDPTIPPRRKPLRLPRQNYRDPGPYFVTVRTVHGLHLLGEVHDGRMELSRAGELVHEEWHLLPSWDPWVSLDAFEVMPNHVHAIVGIGMDAGPRSGKPPHLGQIVGRLKSRSALAINALRGTPGSTVWQRGYYEHVVRNGRAWTAIRQYILANPEAWERDPEKDHGGSGPG